MGPCGFVRWRCVVGTLAVLLALLAVLVVLTLYVIGPHIAESLINGAAISLESMHIDDPRGDSVRLSSTAHVDVDMFLSATLEPTTFSLIYQGALIGAVGSREVTVHAHKPATIAIVNQTMTIANRSAFTAFGRAMLERASVDVVMSGKVTAKLFSAIKIAPVSVSKTLRLTGMDHMRSHPASVVRFDLSHSNTTTAVLDATVRLFNPSVVAMSPLGEITCRLSYDGVGIGELRTPSISLLPGVNNISVSGVLPRFDSVRDAANLTAAGNLLSAHYNNRTVSFESHFVNSTVALYTDLVAGYAFNASIAGTVFQAVRSLNVGGLQVAPIAGNASRIGVTMQASGVFASPLGPNAPLTITALTIDAGSVPTLRNATTNATVGTLRVHSTRLLGAPQPGRVEIEMAGEMLPPDQLDAFGDFFAAIARERSVAARIDGASVSAQVDSQIGHVELHGFPLSVVTSMNGLDGLTDTRADDMLVGANVGDIGDGVYVTSSVSVRYPANITVDSGWGGEFTLYGLDQSQQQQSADVDVNTTQRAASATSPPWTKMGLMNVTTLQLRPGDNTLELSGRLRPEDLAAASRLFSRYVTNQSNSLFTAGLRAIPAADDASGTSPPQWAHVMIRSLSLSAQLAGVFLPSLLVDTHIDDLFLVASPTLVIHRGTIDGKLKVPPSFEHAHLDVHRVVMRSSMGIVEPGYPRGVVAQTFTVNASVVYDNASRNASMTVVDLPLAVVNDTITAAMLSTEIESVDGCHFEVNASATGTVVTGMGEITLANVPVRSGVLSIPGLRGLRAPPLIAVGPDFVAAERHAARVKSKLAAFSFSPATVDLANFTMSGYYQSKYDAKPVYVGRATCTGRVDGPSGCIVGPGWNMVGGLVTVEFTENNTHAVREVLSNFINGTNTTIALHGNPHASANPVVTLAAQKLSALVTLPGVTTRLINRVQLGIDWLHLSASASLNATNPWGIAAEISYANLDVFIAPDAKHPKWQQIGYINSKLDVLLEPHKTGYTKEVDVHLKGFDLRELKALGKGIMTNIRGYMNLTVGGVLEATVDLDLRDVPASIFS